jgi:glycosyltransferase involved in cell wall biosynthesis
MTRTLDTTNDQRALHQRLLAVAPVLLVGARGPDVEGSGSEILDQLVGAVLDSLRLDHLWLLFVAVAARYPTADELSEGIRSFELSGAFAATLWLLDCSLTGASDGSAPRRELVLVRNKVLVDVDHSAKHNLHTGIQQVVRNLLPCWSRDHGVIPVAWTARSGAHRALTPRELRRVLSWSPENEPRPPGDKSEENPILLPWHCVIVMAEVPFGDAPARLSALARHSGNHLVTIGYDCIPIVSADLVPSMDVIRFINYLSVIKHVDRVAGISASAALEFQGFVDALSTQGLSGPVVIACPLPSAPLTVADGRPVARPQRPLVLVVGSFEPRKNHLAVLHAAEKLWRTGLTFELTFIGGSGWGTELPDRIAVLKNTGRPITVLHKADTAALQHAYRSSRFSVFPSMHEGFGLPVAESLAAGTPVITSGFGSMRELACDGGALMIDPRDDAALEVAMRTLLTDDVELEKLRQQIASRPARDWEDYARELWAAIVVPSITPDDEAAPT